LEISLLRTPEHEQVIRVEDSSCGLVGFVALHSTQLGPAAGGLRMRAYVDEAEALDDVLRLSRGMTYKNAAAGLPLGGGKAVIMGDPVRLKTPELLRAFGRAVESFQGRYWTAEDMGMTPSDMAVLGSETQYVAGLVDGPFASGDPSPITAQGIFNAICTTARHKFGIADLTGRHVAVQGLGHVGMHLCGLLHAAGARLTVADLSSDATVRAQKEFAATAVNVNDILSVAADILAPCAIGAILNKDSIAKLKVQVVAGGANNQLSTPQDGARLHQRGILYAPDFVANGGGIINVATEILRIQYRETWVTEKLSALDSTLNRILIRAKRKGVSPNDVAQGIVEDLLRPAAA
jgi:leucine dehydrogenase